MYVLVKNENYGYSTATHGKYVGVGNPGLLRYTPTSASVYWTGSVDIFKYDINIDEHRLIDTLYRKFTPTDDILLAAESASVTSHSLHTELSGYDLINRDKDIAVDWNNYLTTYEDDYGHALDSYDKKFAVGYRYYWSVLNFTGSDTVTVSGSGVDVWDYTYTETNQYIPNEPPTRVGYGFTGSGAPAIKVGDSSSLDFGTIDLTTTGVYYENIYVPAGYNEVWVWGSTTVNGTYAVISKITAPSQGGNVTFAYDWTLTALFTRYTGQIDNIANVYTIENPDSDVTSSFGHSVSINNDWLAVGSPQVSGSTGMVYLYKNYTTGSTLSWSLQQKIEPSNGVGNQLFGWDVSLNKSEDFDYPNRLVVGCGSTENTKVYFYDFTGSSWSEYHIFNPTNETASLAFDPEVLPIMESGSFKSSSFGHSVSTWEDVVVIGAPTERQVYEYSGSRLYQQGTFYIFERCPMDETASAKYTLSKKFYGTQYTLKNNRIGESVSIYDDRIAVGSPKIDTYTLTSCYVQDSVKQSNYCDPDLEDSVTGQWFYFLKNTSSLGWDLQNVYQRKKKFMEPYRAFGFDVSMGDFSISVGAPMLLSDRNRSIDVEYTRSFSIDLDDLAGKDYIYNLKNFKDKFYVGNVFYRNGMVVINTSGSAYEGLYFNPISPYTYEYLWSYSSHHTLYEKQIICPVEPGEFNVSTNPTSITKQSSSWDINNNGEFDFQDVDILLRYMQYKNSINTGSVSFDWSSSILTADDEISFYNFNSSSWQNTDGLFTSSFKKFETTDGWMQETLDINDDNKVDINDIYILWKYFSKRLDQVNYSSYTNPNCNRTEFTDALTYLDYWSQRNAIPYINSNFLDYSELSKTDKTGSYLAPYVSSVGLYDGLDLIAVAKIATPVKIPQDLPINFVVKMDF